MTEEDSKLKILFVDDEPNILNGLKRMLHSMRAEWDMFFIDSGPKALQLFAEKEFDVLVSDMRMPEMNGAELIERVKEVFPSTICFILSGYSDKDLIMQTVKTADQFLSKPCNAEELKGAIKEAQGSKELMEENFLNKVRDMQDLPSLPSIYTQLMDTLADPNCSLKDVEKIIVLDISMSAKILKLVNSAFFGLRNPVSNMNQALVYLGIEVIKSLVLGNHLYSSFSEAEMLKFNIQSMFDHSLHVGVASKAIAKACLPMEDKILDQSFMAGMLHDIGKVIFVRNLPEKYYEVFENEVEYNLPYEEIERQIMGVDHAYVGAYLLNNWGLPSPIVNAVRYHHSPLDSENQSASALTAVHLANYFCCKINNPQKVPILNDRYIGSLGLINKLTECENIVREIMHGS